MNRCGGYVEQIIPGLTRQCRPHQAGCLTEYVQVRPEYERTTPNGNCVLDVSVCVVGGREGI